MCKKYMYMCVERSSVSEDRGLLLKRVWLKNITQQDYRVSSIAKLKGQRGQMCILFRGEAN